MKTERIRRVTPENRKKLGRKPLEFDGVRVNFVADKSTLEIIDRVRGTTGRSEVIRGIIKKWVHRVRRCPGELLTADSTVESE